MGNTVYSPTKEEQQLVKQARSAFALDQTYLEQILWEARRRNNKTPKA